MLITFISTNHQNNVPLKNAITVIRSIPGSRKRVVEQKGRGGNVAARSSKMDIFRVSVMITIEKVVAVCAANRMKPQIALPVPVQCFCFSIPRSPPIKRKENNEE